MRAERDRATKAPPLNWLIDRGRRASIFVTSRQIDMKISHRAWRRAIRLPIYLLVQVLENAVCKAEDLKTAGITDDPKVHLAPVPVGGRNLDEARQTSLLFD